MQALRLHNDIGPQRTAIIKASNRPTALIVERTVRIGARIAVGIRSRLSAGAPRALDLLQANGSSVATLCGTRVRATIHVVPSEKT
jgi:hypothetical protein